VSVRLTARAAPFVAAAFLGGAIACSDDPAGPRAIPYAEVPGSYTLEGTVTEGHTGTIRGSVEIETLDTWGQFFCTADLTIEESGATTLTLTDVPCDGVVLRAAELTFALRPVGRPLTWRFFGGEIQGAGFGTGFDNGEHEAEEGGVTWRGTWRLTRVQDGTLPDQAIATHRPRGG